MLKVFLFFQETNALSTWTIITGLLGSAALAALISLFGIWLQARSQANQQKIAREMEMRREIYFLGAEALGKMQAYLVSLANPMMPDAERNGIVAGVLESLKKVAIIASLDMLTELDKVQAHYNKSTTDLATKKLEFTFHTSQLRIDEATHTNLGQQLVQITTALNAANQQRDRKQQSALIAQYNELGTLYKEQESGLRDRRAHTLKGIQELVGDSIDAALRFEELAAPLNCMVRDELGFPIDNDRYLAMINDSGQRHRALAEEWKKDWHVRFEERAKDSPFDAQF